MSTNNRPNPLTGAEIARLSELETTVQRALGTESGLRDALAAIRDARLYRDTHETFEDYLRDRWSISRPGDYQLAPVRGEGYEVLAKVWDLAREEFGGDDVAAADIRLTVHKREHSAGPTSRPRMNPARLANMDAATLLAYLRWLLTESGGTIADVTDQLEDRATDFDDHARAELRADLLVLDDELAALKAVLAAPADWDGEYGRLLRGEIAPFEDDDDSE